MALDRTWYNALVDDSGDGISGSVWDKADIKNLLDSVDAELARIESAGSIVGVWTPTLLCVGGSGTPIYSTQQASYVKNGKLIHVAGRVAISSKGSLTGSALAIGGLPFPGYGFVQSALTVGYFSGLAIAVASIAGYMDPSAPNVFLSYLPPAGASTANVMGAATIGPSADLIFGGTYRSS
jgi:hypothetical protein